MNPFPTAHCVTLLQSPITQEGPLPTSSGSLASLFSFLRRESKYMSWSRSSFPSTPPFLPSCQPLGGARKPWSALHHISPASVHTSGSTFKSRGEASSKPYLGLIPVPHV